MRSTFSRLPDVSPFIQSAFRVRLKNVAKPLSTVRSSAVWFMNPTISTSCVDESCTTAGIKPFNFEKSIDDHKEKSPAEHVQRGSCWLRKVSSVSRQCTCSPTGPPEQE